MPLPHSGELDRLADHNYNVGVEETGDRLLVLDFGASWCEGRKAAEASIEALATEFGSDIYVAAIDLDHRPKLTDHFNVMSIPLVAMLRAGEVMGRLQGARSKDALKQEIDAALKPVL